MHDSVQDSAGTLSCFSIRKAGMACSVSQSEQSRLPAAAVSLLHSYWGLCWEIGASESAMQFYAFLNKGAAGSRTRFIRGLGICRTLTCRPIIMMLVSFPKWMLFILKEALLRANKSSEGPETLACEWSWLSFKIIICWI